MNPNNRHQFRVQINPLNGAGPTDGVAQQPLQFDVQSHEDILAIARRMRYGTSFADSQAYALAIGLKLFTGVMLTHSGDPLFADIQPVMRTFIRKLKSQVMAARPLP